MTNGNEPNPYAAPTTESPRGVPAGGGGDFYIVSNTKFLILYLGTFGIYGVVWFYRHWATVRAQTGEVLSPLGRSIFNVFFVHKLFRRFSEAALLRDQHPPDLNGGATIYIVLSVVGNGISRVGDKVPDVPLVSLIGLLLLLASVVPLSSAQSVANTASGDPEGSSNASFSGANLVVLFLGLLFWSLTLYGTYLAFTTNSAS
jgi:hypothetical protein